MSYVWSTSSVCYYMINLYMQFLPGNIYKNSFASSFSEICAVIIGSAFYTLLQQKNCFTASFSIAAIGGLLITFSAGCNNNEFFIPLYVMIAKFGISCSYMFLYMVQVDMFPTLFSATAFGICNQLSSIATISAPYLA